jgi:hypothetical protein
VAQLQQCLSDQETSRHHLLTKTSVASKWFCLKTNMNPLRKDETLTNMMLFPVLFYDHKCHGTRLKSVQLICQLLSVASEQLGLHTNMSPPSKGENLMNMSVVLWKVALSGQFIRYTILFMKMVRSYRQ